MTPIPPLTAQPVFSEATFALVLVLLLLAPLAIAGVALINTGLGRSRSAAQSLLGSLAIVAVTVIVFALIGATFTGSIGGTGHAFHVAGKPWNWIGAGPLFLASLNTAPAQSQLGLLFEFLAVALAALIPWGSGADRLRLTAGCAIAAVLAAFVFPLFAHWAWSVSGSEAGGWLSQLGANFSLGAGFLDPAGAAAIHVLGGLSALAVAWIAGPRRASAHDAEPDARGSLQHGGGSARGRRGGDAADRRCGNVRLFAVGDVERFASLARQHCRHRHCQSPRYCWVDR